VLAAAILVVLWLVCLPGLPLGLAWWSIYRRSPDAPSKLLLFSLVATTATYLWMISLLLLFRSSFKGPLTNRMILGNLLVASFLSALWHFRGRQLRGKLLFSSLTVASVWLVLLVMASVSSGVPD